MENTIIFQKGGGLNNADIRSCDHNEIFRHRPDVVEQADYFQPNTDRHQYTAPVSVAPHRC